MEKLEDILQVKKFQSEWHKVTINIVHTANWLNTALEARANKVGITVQQFNVLRILRGQYPHPVKNTAIKSRMLTKTSDISRLVDRLVTKELVERTSSATDRRAVDLVITQRGLDLLQNIEDEMMLNDILPKNISAEACEQLNQLLDQFKYGENLG